MDIQARIPAALCAIHNYICTLKPEAFLDPEFALNGIGQDEEDVEALGILAEGPANAGERRRAEARCELIAEEMWVEYQAELRQYQAAGQVM